MDNPTLPIAVDAMGGDNAPAAVLRGVVKAIEEIGANVTVVGPRQQLVTELALAGARDHVVSGRLAVVDAAEVVGMDEHPAAAVRGKRDSSIVRACQLVGGGEAVAVVSAGNSGATLAAALAHIRRIPGVARPAIGVIIPSLSGRTFLIDAGANADCKAEWLAQFAVMGSVFAREVMGVQRPRVALLSNGEERSKGSAPVQAAATLLDSSALNFTGNVEGRDVFSGVADVVVSDGFTGNVLLKTAEGVAEMLFSLMRNEAAASTRGRLGGLLLKPRLSRLRTRLDYRNAGGALLLGVAGEVVIAHGRSDDVAIANAIRVAHDAASRRVSQIIRTQMSEASGLSEMTSALAADAHSVPETVR
ncbi:MAG TPA: phosphate acyltransferase PlsX [Candidatus Sulfotelmatobacter sp.]|nr:phosphate acyltransferase PlsX [Candidatus Sulfotelmatobacter sp.]